MNSKFAMNTNTKMLLTGGFWVRVAIIAAAGYIFMQKDINFQVNVQAPSEQQVIEEEQPKEVGKETKSDQELSDNQSESSSFNLKGLSASLFGLRKQVKDQPIPPRKQTSLTEVSDEQVDAYINRFSNVAISEMRKFEIPASIILASSLIQSSAGLTDYSKSANNYFQITCDHSWEGMMKDYDGICYRKYESAWAGFRDHSRYISQNFSSLKKYGTKDYKNWAKGLEKGKFSKDKKFAQKLISVIDKYDLKRFDKR